MAKQAPASLTERQRDVYERFMQHRRLHGVSPTCEELAKALSLSTSAIYEKLAALVDRGYLKRTGGPGSTGKWRNLVPVHEPKVLQSEAIDIVRTVFAELNTESKEALESTIVMRLSNARLFI